MFDIRIAHKCLLVVHNPECKTYVMRIWVYHEIRNCQRHKPSKDTSTLQVRTTIIQFWLAYWGCWSTFFHENDTIWNI